MKTSNKILLGAFLTVIFLIITVLGVVYAKYKRGDTVSFEEIRNGRLEEHKLPNIKYVSVSGYFSCRIIPSDTARIQILKTEGPRVSYSIVKDTLFINGDSLLKKEDYERGVRLHELVNLYLPPVERISAFHSELQLNGSRDTAFAPSYTIYLADHSKVSTYPFGKFRHMHFKRLHISANNASNVEFNSGTVIDSLNIQSAGSTINNRNATIQHLQMQIDSSSTVILFGKSLKNANITQ